PSNQRLLIGIPEAHLDMSDTFQPRIPEEFLRELLDLGREFGFDPMASVELEGYCATMIIHIAGKAGELGESLRPELSRSFRSLVSPPRWIQGANWQVSRGQPG